MIEFSYSMENKNQNIIFFLSNMHTIKFIIIYSLVVFITKVDAQTNSAKKHYAGESGVSHSENNTGIEYLERGSVNADSGYRMVTTDIDNFWSAFDALEHSKDSIRTFQEMYIDNASPEFKKFLALREFTATQYIDKIRSYPKFWNTIRPLTILSVKEKRDEINSIYDEFSKLYPDFDPPNICFAISPIATGGNAIEELIFLGTEIAAVDPDRVDVSEIKGFMGDVFQNSNGDITSLVTHELVHSQQPNIDNVTKSLLSQAIIEGSADFIATLILGRQTMNNAVFEYGEKNQKELWAEFTTDMETNKTYDETSWFYNYSEARPADLGYYLGYKIVEAYYQNAMDKKQAIKEILKMEKPEELLKKSKL